MYTERELTDEILIMTMLINKRYPELSKYIGEMPVTIPDEQHPHINEKILLEYYDSLVAMFIDYGATHGGAMV